jgi:hypothetical protein
MTNNPVGDDPETEARRSGGWEKTESLSDSVFLERHLYKFLYSVNTVNKASTKSLG